MRVWIDDIRKMPEKYDVHIRSYSEARELLIAHAKDIKHISFDHDLGVDPNWDKEKTGYDIACIIEDFARKGLMKPITWEIHSANPVGSKNIEVAMKKAEEYWYEK